MSDVELRVAERLRGLAGHAEAPDPAAVLAAVATAGRARRRRTTRWTAGVVTLAVLAGAAGVAEARDGHRRTDTGPASAVADPDRPELYGTPPQGAAAADREFRTRLAARSWADPSGEDRAGIVADPDGRRVVYAADVPGGHRWAVVVGRAAGEWVYAWFAGPTGADADQLQLAAPVAQVGRTAPLALMDLTSSPAPLVVLGRPGDAVEYSAGTERAPDGTLARTYDIVPQVAGVPTAAVSAPMAWDAGQVVLLRDGSRTLVPLVTTGSPPSPVVTWGPNPPDPAVLAACLAPFGIEMKIEADGSTATTWTGAEQLSSAEQAAREAAQARCQALATGGG